MVLMMCTFPGEVGKRQLKLPTRKRRGSFFERATKARTGLPNHRNE
jgi:hypothetical protein